MTEQKIYEKCEHEWETIDQYQEYIATSGNFITGGYNHYKIIFIQKCKKCGKINKI